VIRVYVLNNAEGNEDLLDGKEAEFYENFFDINYLKI